MSEQMDAQSGGVKEKAMLNNVCVNALHLNRWYRKGAGSDEARQKSFPSFIS